MIPGVILRGGGTTVVEVMFAHVPEHTYFEVVDRYLVWGRGGARTWHTLQSPLLLTHRTILLMIH